MLRLALVLSLGVGSGLTSVISFPELLSLSFSESTSNVLLRKWDFLCFEPLVTALSVSEPESDLGLSSLELFLERSIGGFFSIVTLMGTDCSCSVSVSVSESAEETAFESFELFLTILTPLTDVFDEVFEDEPDESDEEERDFLWLVFLTDVFVVAFFSTKRAVSCSSELFDVKSKLSVRSVSRDLLSEEDVIELSKAVSGLENCSILLLEWDLMTFWMDLSMERDLLSVVSSSSSLRLFFFDDLLFLDFDMNVFLKEFFILEAIEVLEPLLSGLLVRDLLAVSSSSLSSDSVLEDLFLLPVADVGREKFDVGLLSLFVFLLFKASKSSESESDRSEFLFSLDMAVLLSGFPRAA